MKSVTGFRFAVLVLIFLVCFPAFSLSFDSDFRSAAMGGIAVPGTGNEISFFSNPASIHFYNQKQKFVFQTSVYDNHDSGTSMVIEKPELNFRGLFIGKAVALGLGGNLYVSDMQVSDSDIRSYTGFRRFDIALSAAYGFKNFALGGAVYSGSSSHNPNIEIDRKKALGDFISNALLAEHTRLGNSEFVNIRFGIMYNVSGFSLSAKSDKILSYEGGQDELSFEYAVDTVCFGLYYNRDRYRKRGRLNTWIFSAGIEGRNVFDDKGTLNAGAGIGFQLSRDYTVELRFGYQALFEKLDEGWQSIGLGARLENFDLGIVYEMPVKDWKDIYRIGVDFAFLI